MKKLTSILALLLCMVMLFTSCFGKDTGDDPAVTTDPSVPEQNQDPFDPEEDINAVVKTWNDALKAEAPEMDVNELIFDMLDKYKLSVSDIKVDGEELGGRVIVNSEEIYLCFEDEYVYVKFEVDGNKIDILSIEAFEGYVEDASFNRLDLDELFAAMGDISFDADAIQLPEIKSEDVKDEGDRTYALSRDVIDDIIDSYLELYFDSFGVSDSDMRETKALVNGYLEDITIDIKYRFDGDDISTIFSIDVPEDVYLDIMDNSYEDDVIKAIKAVKHDYSFKLSIEESKKSVNVAVDVNVPVIFDYEDNGTVYVEHTGISGEVNLSPSELLSKNAEKIKIDVEVASEYAAYEKRGAAYVKGNPSDYDWLPMSSTSSVEVSFVGEELKGVVSTEYDGETDSTEFSCKLSFGKDEAVGLSIEMAGYVSKFEAMRAKYDGALANAESALKLALFRLEPEDQVDTYEFVTYYDAELGAYFEFEVSCYEGQIGFDYSLSSVSFIDPENYFFIKGNGMESVPAIYSVWSPDLPVINFDWSYDMY